MEFKFESFEKWPINHHIPIELPRKNYINEFTNKNKKTLLKNQLSDCLSYADNLLKINSTVIFNLDHFLYLLEQISDPKMKVRFFAKDFQNRKKEIFWMAKVDSKLKNPKCYDNFKIQKKSGGERNICAPVPRLKKIQSWILEKILYQVRYSCNECAHGFIKNKSIVTNATPHLNKKIILNLDIKDFFPSITYARVRGLFCKFGYSEYLSDIFTSLCTYKELLPQGAPTSPMISNIICRNLDRRLTGFADKHNFSYTRYADDITFSGGYNLLRHKDYIVSLTEDEDFTIAQNKIRVRGQGKSQVVTGIITNEKLNINRKIRKNLRATIYNCKTNGIMSDERNHDVTFRNSIYGLVSMINMVRPDLAKKYWQELDSLDWNKYNEWRNIQLTEVASSKPKPSIEDKIEKIQIDIKKIIDTTDEIKLQTEEINKTVIKIFDLINKQPDLIEKRLREIVKINRLNPTQNSKIKKLLDKYIKISDFAQKSEFWIKNLKLLIQIAPILISLL